MSTPRLRGLTWDHPRGYQPLVAAAAGFRERRGVEIEWSRRSLKEFGDTPIDTLAGHYDLLVIDHPHVGIAAASGCLWPLDGLIDGDVLAALADQSAGPSHASYRYGGRQWALAVDAAMQTSSYRKGMLPAPLPRDWPAVLELARRLRSRGLWIAVPLVPTDAVCCFLTLCAGAGAGLREGEGFVDQAVGRRVLSLLRALVEAAHPDSLEWNPIALYEAMSTGEEIAYCPIAFCYSNYARNGYRPNLLEFADLPGVRGSLLGGAGIAVTTSCSEPAVAAEFAAWVCGSAVQRGLYTASGGQPGNLTAWLDERCNSLTNGFFSGILATLRGAYLRPRDQGFVSYQEYAGRRIHQFLGAADGSDEEVESCFADLTRAYRERTQAERGGA
jgi:multiple sugar transport system substrate-binding protein